MSKFDPTTIPLKSHILIVGKKCCGKTTLLHHLREKMQTKYKHVHEGSPTQLLKPKTLLIWDDYDSKEWPSFYGATGSIVATQGRIHSIHAQNIDFVFLFRERNKETIEWLRRNFAPHLSREKFLKINKNESLVWDVNAQKMIHYVYFNQT